VRNNNNNNNNNNNGAHIRDTHAGTTSVSRDGCQKKGQNELNRHVKCVLIIKKRRTHTRHERGCDKRQHRRM